MASLKFIFLSNSFATLFSLIKSEKRISESRLGDVTIKNEGEPFFDLHTIAQVESRSFKPSRGEVLTYSTESSSLDRASAEFNESDSDLDGSKD